MSIITRFDRREFKFVIDAAQQAWLIAALGERVTPDPHAGPEGSYPVVGLYFDNAGRDIYWESRRGLKSRRKLRVRVYGSPGSPHAPVSFLEVKHRYGGRVAKRRSPLPVATALALAEGEPELPEGLTGLELRVIEEARRMFRERALRPACVIRYDRQAFSGREAEADLRVTFDRELLYRVDALHPLPDDRHFERRILPADQRVLEVKVDDAVPLWLARLLGEAGCVLQSFSKYCRIVELELEPEAVRPALRAAPAMPPLAARPSALGLGGAEG